MQDLNTADVRTALDHLGEVCASRLEQLQQYDIGAVHSSSDEDNDSDAPIVDSFYHNGGSAAIKSMTNFDAREFRTLWERLSPHIAGNWNIGRGRRCSFQPKDVMFMTLAVLKHGGHWDFLGRMFRVKGPTFERLITQFISMISAFVYEKYVLDVNKTWCMKDMTEIGKGFSNYKFARYATDVTFQQSNRPCGNIDEAKKYFSGKHKLYGYKVEVSVLPVGFAIFCSDHYYGSKSDIDIFHEMRSQHRSALEKTGRDGNDGHG